MTVLLDPLKLIVPGLNLSKFNANLIHFVFDQGLKSKIYINFSFFGSSEKLKFGSVEGTKLKYK